MQAQSGHCCLPAPAVPAFLRPEQAQAGPPSSEPRHTVPELQGQRPQPGAGGVLLGGSDWLRHPICQVLLALPLKLCTSHSRPYTRCPASTQDPGSPPATALERNVEGGLTRGPLDEGLTQGLSPVPLAPRLSSRLFPWPPAAPGDPWRVSLCARPLTHHLSGRLLGPPGRSPSEPLTQTHASGASSTLPHCWRPSPATRVRVSAELHSKTRSMPGRGEAGHLPGALPLCGVSLSSCALQPF